MIRESSEQNKVRSLITEQEAALRRYEEATQKLLAACALCPKRSWIGLVLEGRWLRHNHIGITLSEQLGLHSASLTGGSHASPTRADAAASGLAI